jgi:hypothetical protein
MYQHTKRKKEAALMSSLLFVAVSNNILMTKDYFVQAFKASVAILSLGSYARIISQ